VTKTKTARTLNAMRPFRTTPSHHTGHLLEPGVGPAATSRPGSTDVTLDELLAVIRRRWKVVVAVAAVLTVGAAVYAASLPSYYRASAVVAISPRKDVGVRLVLLGAPEYLAYISSRSTLRTLAATVGEDPRVLERDVEATLLAQTGNITVSAKAPSQRRAAALANMLAEQILAHARNDRFLTADLVAPAIGSRTPAGPPRRMIVASWLGAGLIVGALVAAGVDRVRVSPGSAQDARRPG
jgi:capsular polysaccharide biosynthesis protein